MDLHALGEQVGRRLVVGSLHGGEDRARRAHKSFSTLDEPADHLGAVGWS